MVDSIKHTEQARRFAVAMLVLAVLGTGEPQDAVGDDDAAKAPMAESRVAAAGRYYQVLHDLAPLSEWTAEQLAQGAPEARDRFRKDLNVVRQMFRGSADQQVDDADARKAELIELSGGFAIGRRQLPQTYRMLIDVVAHLRKYEQALIAEDAAVVAAYEKKAETTPIAPSVSP